MAEYGIAKVDRTKCFSYAACVDLLPGVFRLDEEGISIPGTRPTASLSALNQAADDCPMQAISVFPSEPDAPGS